MEENKMGTAPVRRLLLSMSWPAVLSMSIGALYNIVDSIFVAMISTKALTAVSLVMPFQILIIAVGVGSGVGANSLIARRLGERRKEEADKAASASVRMVFFHYLIFLLSGLFLSRFFIESYTDDAAIIDAATIYMRIVCCASLPFLMQLTVEKVMQASGDMIAPMITALSGAAVNLTLDPILIFGLFGAPKMGVAGAAVATVAGQTVAVTVALILVRKRSSEVEILWRGYKLNWQTVGEIYKVGLPSIIMQAIGSFMLIAYNSIIADSVAAVAVLGLYFKLQSLVFMPVFGLTQGALPIMGYNYGAKNSNRLMRTLKVGIIGATAYMFVCTIVFLAAPEFLLKLFSADSEMMEIGVPALRIVSLSFVIAAPDVIGSTFFQATGHGIYSLIGSLIRQFAGILPIAYVLYNYVGVKASWASFPIAEIMGLVYAVIMMMILYKKEIKDL